MSDAPPVDREMFASISRGGAPLKGLTLDQLPRLREGLIEASHAVHLSGDVQRHDVSVPGLAGQPDVTMRIHRPVSAGHDAPCLFAIHGGGYLMGTYEVEDQRLDAWCRRLDAVGVSVDYRLAPETTYPGALDDCVAGMHWVFEHALELGIDPARIGILGTSAGGSLALASCLRLRDEGHISAPAFQLISYPMIDDRQVTASSRWNDVPVWDSVSNQFAWRCYLGALYGAPEVPEYAAPARATDLRGLPPTFLSVGTCDVVCDETVDFAQRLYRTRVSTDLHVYAGAPHGMDRRATDSVLSRAVRRDMLAWLTRQIATPSS